MLRPKLASLIRVSRVLWLGLLVVVLGGLLKPEAAVQPVSSGANGTLSGTPTAAGTYAIRVRPTAANGPSSEKDLRLTEMSAQTESDWILKSPANSPSPRLGHAMAYDAARGNVVLFGGSSNGPSHNDTWVWDGTNWIQKSPANRPAGRSDHAMAYDAARGQVVLFGGLATNFSNDTWVWDGTNWTFKSPANRPAPRISAAMAYDAARGQVVLFGGLVDVGGFTRTNDTWIWDGTNWIQKSPANSPTPREGAAMAYDAARGQVVLFGGSSNASDGNNSNNETWVWDGTNWTQKNPANSPMPLDISHAMAYDAAREEVVLFGGADNTWVWDGTNWIQKSPAHSPTPRSSHAMAYDAAREQVVLFGGFPAAGLANDTWVLTASQCGTGSFAAKTDFGTGIFPTSVAAGDFNGDGKLDLATANRDSDTVSVLLGTGTGSFGAKTDFGTGVQPASVAVGDFNGDGKVDLAVANRDSDTVSVLLATGTGSFGAKTDFGTGVQPASVAVGDFNGDGKFDLAVANFASATVSILLGTGTGSFGANTDFGTGGSPVSVAVGDFNGDGKLDLAVANRGDNTVSILLGTGTGSFGAKTDFGTGVQPNSVAVGDFNGDGKLDLAVANLFSNTVSILLGTGTGSFGAKTDFGIGFTPLSVALSVAVGDFNGDGKLDLAVAPFSSNTVSILLGTGTGSFGAKTGFGTGGDPTSVAVGDFNGDGKLDLAVANRDSDTVSILLNACSSSTSPSITANPITRTAGSPSANSQIATVNDAQDAPNTLSVTVNGGTSATVNGVTVSGISVNVAGVVTADVVAACGATTANFTLHVTDSGGLFNDATLTVTVNADNQPPTITCPANITTTTAMINDTCRVVTYAAPASENCPSVTAVCAPSSGSCFPVGTTTVNCTATDGSGNTAPCSFTITVDDGFNCQGTVVKFFQAPPISPLILCPLSVDQLGNAPWACDQYDDHVNTTIREKGCAMTALAMALLKAGITTVPLNGQGSPPLNPGTLNQFMIEHRWGYDANHDVQFDTTVESIDHSLKFLDVLSSNQKSTEVLDQLLCQGVPVIVGIHLSKEKLGHEKPGHYVLVTGKQGNKYKIVDPGQRANTTLDPNDGFSIRGQVVDAGHRSVTTRDPNDGFSIRSQVVDPPGDVSALNLSVGDAELLIIDPTGNRTGFDSTSGTIREEIPRSTHFIDSLEDDLTGAAATEVSYSVPMFQPQQGTYQVVLIGLELGTYTLSISSFSQDGSPQPAVAVSGMTQPGLESTYVIAYSSTPGAALRVFGITAAPVTVTAGNPSANSLIATVNDAQGAPNTLSVTVNGGTGATVNGVTVTLNPTAPNASGQVFADVVAACTATTATFTLRVTDSGGLFTETTLTVTVNPDNQPPAINCAAVTAQSANADANCQAVVPDVRTLVRAQSSDNCTAQASLTVTQNPVQGSIVSGTGSHPIVATVTDASNNSTDCTVAFTVNDTTAPVINCGQVAAQSANADANCEATVPDARALVRAQSSDNCTANGALAVSQTPTQGSTVSGAGSHPIAVMVTDSSNNSSICTVGFTVIDNTPPTIACPSSITVPTAPGLCSATVTYASPTVSDNCPGVGAPICSPTSGSSFPKGTTTIACSVTDASSNKSNCAFSVTVVDQEPPKIACSGTVSIVATSSCPFPTTRVLTFPTPTASDNCPGVTTACNPPAGSIVPIGTTNVTCIATDTSGNTTQCSFAVHVFSFCLQDGTDPTNFVFINAATGDYEFYCGGFLIASGTGVFTNRGCIESIDHSKGDRRVLILFDTAAQSGRGAGTATLQIGPNNIKCRITDQDMSDNSCSVLPPVVRFAGK